MGLRRQRRSLQRLYRYDRGPGRREAGERKKDRRGYPDTKHDSHTGVERRRSAELPDPRVARNAGHDGAPVERSLVWAGSRRRHRRPQPWNEPRQLLGPQGPLTATPATTAGKPNILGGQSMSLARREGSENDRLICGAPPRPAPDGPTLASAEFHRHGL